MTVMPRGKSRWGKGRRSSFVASGRRPTVVPDALSWRDQLGESTAPKGAAAWAAASSAQSGRTIVDAGPYGLVDLAAVDATFDGAPRDMGVVWWDKRSYRQEDHDDETIQTAFVPASIADHVSLAGPVREAPAGREPSLAPPHPHTHGSSPTEGASRGFLETVYGDGGTDSPARPVPAHGPTASLTEELRPRKTRERKVHPAAASVTVPAPAGAPASAPAPAAELLAEPVPAARQAPVEERPRRGHARRSRHVALVPKRRGIARESSGTQPRRDRLRRRRMRRRLIVGTILVLVAFVTTFLIQSAIITPFTVPSVSMENTLHVGDRILVNRAAYAGAEMHRGDVVVFRDPGGWLTNADRPGGKDTGDYLVKRIVGLPGDHVACCGTNGKLTVNGVEVEEPDALVPDASNAANPFDVTVPSGALWVLGDNRFKSRDSSRVQDLPSKGFVPIKNVVGEAVLKVWPLTDFSPIPSARDAFAAVPDPSCPI